MDYTTRFKSARHVFKSQYGGRLELPKAVEARAEEQEEDFEEAESKQLRKDTYDMWIAYVFLCNADREKYHSVIDELSNQFALGNNQYPTDLVNVSNVLSNRWFDQSFFGKKKKNKAKHYTNENESK